MALDIEKLERELLRDEAEILHAYKDSEGWWTIGEGHLIDPRKGAKPPPEMTWPDGPGVFSTRCTISKDVSARLRGEDIALACAALDRSIPWWSGLTDPRSTALVNMVFNMGLGNAHHGLLSFANTLELIRTGHYAEAAQHLRTSAWRSQVGARADRLIKQIETGTWQ